MLRPSSSLGFQTSMALRLQTECDLTSYIKHNQYRNTQRHTIGLASKHNPTNTPQCVLNQTYKMELTNHTVQPGGNSSLHVIVSSLRNGVLHRLNLRDTGMRKYTHISHMHTHHHLCAAYTVLSWRQSNAGPNCVLELLCCSSLEISL